MVFPVAINIGYVICITEMKGDWEFEIRVYILIRPLCKNLHNKWKS